jgi:hypothetical protein
VDDVLLELCPADEGLDCELALDPWPLVDPADWLELVSWLWATTNALASSITANIPIRFFISCSPLLVLLNLKTASIHSLSLYALPARTGLCASGREVALTDLRVVRSVDNASLRCGNTGKPVRPYRALG